VLLFKFTDSVLHKKARYDICSSIEKLKTELNNLCRFPSVDERGSDSKQRLKNQDHFLVHG
jgi:hypothetical protein